MCIRDRYDLSQDPGETTNLYHEKPEIADRLLTQLKSDVANGRSTQGPASANDVKDIVLWKSDKVRKKTKKKSSKKKAK